MRNVLFLIFLCSKLTWANSPDCIHLEKKTIRDHVAYLSSDALAGRLTGSEGEQLATQYVADHFACLGLEPAGDKGTFFQSFEFTSGVSYGAHNELWLSIRNEHKKLILDKDWRPLSFSDSLAFNQQTLIFAGYGITAPASGALPAYDSYHHLNVKDKWVIVLRYTPEKASTEYTRHLNQYSSPRYKAFTAKNHGAKGIIFVSGPNSKVKNQLLPLSFDAALSGSGIAAISITDKVLADLITQEQFKKVQDQLDTEQYASLQLASIQIKGQINIQQHKKQGRNVLAKLKLNSEKAPALIVGAHIDHLGHGELSGSRAKEQEKGRIHYGADDNASGVASVLAAATALSDMNTHRQLTGTKDILFAIWSGEELGLFGSTHFINQLKQPHQSLSSEIGAAINLDMVGHLKEHLILQGIGSSNGWLPLLATLKNSSNISFITQKDPYLPTDSTSFYLNGIPTVNLFTGSHDEYHTPRDKTETLNYQGLNHISHFLVNLILALETNATSLDYQHIAKAQNGHRQGFKVYLGTIPDYADTTHAGVKLSGVSKNSPAEQAGIQSGDLIIELSGKKIHDIYDYTYILSSLHAGEKTSMVVQRGSQKIKLQITAQSRE